MKSGKTHNKTICVVGAGHVGLVVAAGFAELGHAVACLDLDEAKIGLLSQGIMSIYEPGLRELLLRNVAGERLTFTSDYRQAMGNSDFVFVAVNTPSTRDGTPDLGPLYAAARGIGQHMNRTAIVVIKSTVPVGTSEKVARIIARERGDGARPFVVSCPEFLSQGRAVADFLHPPRVVIGAADTVSAQAVASLYEPLGCPLVICDPRTAEMTKYAHNAFLATKISFINEMAGFCDRLGADVKAVSQALGLDPRIGSAFLGAGLGWGGSCFPKDVRALIRQALAHGARHEILRAALRANYAQRSLAVEKLRLLLGTLEDKVIGLLGLAFKPNTEDIRDAPSLDIIRMLRGERAFIKAYDPQATPFIAATFPDITCCADPYEVAQGCDALLLVTEWEEFRSLDMPRIRSLMARPVFVDGRNLFDPQEMAGWGFVYQGIGRGTSASPVTAQVLV